MPNFDSARGVLAVFCPACLPPGPVPLSATDVFQALAAHLGLSGISVEPTRLLVVGDIRLARVCLAILCGGCLAVAGVALQGVLRNPLADPFTLGISAGAACGASLAIVFFGGAPALAHSLGLSHTGLIAAAALAGALAALFCAIRLERVVLAGIAVSAFLGAIVALVKALHEASVGYGDRLVLRNVNFTARKGESVALLSPNGSGKTTLSRAVSGILRPQRGTISLCGQSIESLRPRERARRATVVPQCGHFPAGLNVRQMVLLGRYQYLSWFGGYRRGDYAVADEALAAVGALELSERKVERAFRRGIAAGAAGLDLARELALFDLLECRRAAGVCVIMAMHDCNLAAFYATRIMGIQKGSVLFDG